jgi:hypothetical protein
MLHRKQLQIIDFALTAALEAKLTQLIAAWKTGAHPFD